MPSQAQGSRIQLAIVPEADYGVTPPTPATQLIEFVSFSGTITADTLVDESIRPDRQTSYARSGNRSAEGSLDVVLAPGNYDQLLEAALMGTWTGDVLRIGTVDRSFAFEQGFTDLGEYRVFNGMKVNTLGMEVTTDALVTATFGLFGASTTAFAPASIDAAPTAIATRDKFYHEGGTFSEGGAPVAYLSAVGFELTNNITGNYALGSTGFRNVTTGRAEVTGTATALFESVDLYNKFINNDDTSLSFTLRAGPDSLTFTFPRVKYTSGNIAMSGDAGVTVELGWSAIYDATAGTTMSITRATA